jgi:hypothetical protein
MSRADELRAQLAAVEAEDAAQADLDRARETYREAPDDPAAKAAARAAAETLRRVRAEQRVDRDLTKAHEDLAAAEQKRAEAPDDEDVFAAVLAARSVVQRLERLVPVDATAAPGPAAASSGVGKV